MKTTTTTPLVTLLAALLSTVAHADYDLHRLGLVARLPGHRAAVLHPIHATAYGFHFSAGADNTPAAAQTVFIYDFDTATNTGKGLSLDVGVPGGQQVTVDPATAALVYNTPHSHSPENVLPPKSKPPRADADNPPLPDSQITGPFKFRGRSTPASPHGLLSIPGRAIACPGLGEPASFQVFSAERYMGKDKAKCVSVQLVSVPATGKVVDAYE